jgi:hypothetical protein
VLSRRLCSPLFRLEDAPPRRRGGGGGAADDDGAGGGGLDGSATASSLGTGTLDSGGVCETLDPVLDGWRRGGGRGVVFGSDVVFVSGAVETGGSVVTCTSASTVGTVAGE